MDSQNFQIRWVQEIANESEIITEEEIITLEPEDENEETNDVQRYLVQEISPMEGNIDQIAAENLIYMAQDGQVTTMENLIQHTDEMAKDEEGYDENQIFECQVTEEVITDDWVQQQGEERVEIPVTQICPGGGEPQTVEELDVLLPTDQDEYTALRPYPCDFCSRRFRKKVSLMNHMIAHQNDRPHVCNLCGARYIRRSDLLNHLKIHAHAPDDNRAEDLMDSYMNDHIEARPPGRQEVYESENYLTKSVSLKPRGNRGKKNKNKQEESNEIFIEQNYQMRDNVLQETILENNHTEKFPIIDPRKPFVCQQCGVGFGREKALLSHSRIHRNDSPHECPSCNEMFWDPISLQEHQRSHHFEASNSEYEPENDEDTDSDNDSKYGEFYCEVCGMSFHRQDLLKRHTKSHIKKEYPEGDIRHCCNVCGETFAEALDLLAHAEVHARFQPFKCMLCGETFLEEATIKKHLNNVHSTEMTPNSCRLCGKLCKDGRSLMKHAWDHSREKNHPCSKCGKTFHNKARLKRHMVSHRNKSVVCDVCQEEFPDGRSLMNHRHSHSNTSGKLFPCNECGKTFGSRSSQQIHIRIHTGERPYGCRFCWKAFADGGTLRKHERIHTGEKPYACSVCPRAFNQRVVLREHIRSHHSALDCKRGTYYCTVCSDTLPSSAELIQHLIQHSDMNTAMQRQPITGPRKYKRRRKLKPHEIERLRQEKQSSDIEYSDFDVGNVDDLLGIGNKSKKSRNATSTSTTKNYNDQITPSVTNNFTRDRKYSGNSDKFNSSWQNKLAANTDDSFNAVFQNLENALQNIEPLVVGSSTNLSGDSPNFSQNPSTLVTGNSRQISLSSPSNKSSSPLKTTSTGAKRRPTKLNTSAAKPSRPKMIHTSKKRVAVEDGKRKTRTLITRTQPTVLNDNLIQQQQPTHRSTKGRKTRRQDEHEYILPDVKVPNIESEIANEVAIKREGCDQSTRSDLFDAQLLLEAASVGKEAEKYNSTGIEELDDILKSPRTQKYTPEAQKLSSPKGNIKFEKRPTTNSQKGKKGGKGNSKANSTISRKAIESNEEGKQDNTHETSMQTILQEEDLRRSTRLRRSATTKRYLDFEISIKQSFSNKQPQSSQQQPSSKRAKQEKFQNKSSEENMKSDKSDKIRIKTEPNSPGRREIKEELFQCEMCSATFSDRPQLLVHVPIHI